jgi:hypothetical protein
LQDLRRINPRSPKVQQFEAQLQNIDAPTAHTQPMTGS